MIGRKIIEKILEYLDMKAPTFAESIGVKYQRIFDIQQEKTKKISGDLANCIVEKYNQFNINWLLTGEGEMLKTNDNLLRTELELPFLTTAAGISYFKMPGGKFIMKVPTVPVYAYAKYIDEVRDAEIWEGNGYSYFPVDQIFHGNYQAFEIKGDSMDDDSKRSLSHGDIVNARELSRDKWASRLHTDQYPNWIIVTDTTVLCKQIINQNLETGDIICHSLNPSPEYTDFTINLNDVRKLFNIVQRVSSSF